MRLRHQFAKPIREKVEIKVGDAVYYEGTKYIVMRYGLRYVSAYLEGDPKQVPYLLKVKHIMKVPPPPPEPENTGPDGAPETIDPEINYPDYLKEK